MQRELHRKEMINKTKGEVSQGGADNCCGGKRAKTRREVRQDTKREPSKDGK